MRDFAPVNRPNMLRATVALLCFAVATPVFAQTNGAANYPNRAVHVVVPFPPGGPTDTYARILADKLQASLEKPFIVENKAGATGIIGTSFVANAAADGYTLLFGANSSQVISGLLQSKRPFDPLRDFRPLSMLLYYPMALLLNNDVPARSVAELVALGKAQPAKLNMGSVGIGSGGHLAIEMFKNATGISAVHVPYKGAAPAEVGLMAGEIHFLFNSMEVSQALLNAGKLRAIAVTGRERSPVAPDVPTIKETGYDGFEDLVIWLGMLAPAGTPELIAKKLEAELMRIAQLPDVSKRVKESASVLVGGTGKDFADAIARETPVWASIIKKNNITLGN
ncbi:MAG: putative tricarboxylic transport rane protein [Alphaproteobacteria bacterium]|nr:putative tricarboxylic transport rane protein [Alphaproteobacteria bacterium]